MRGIILFIRTEKSIKEFFEYYPIVSIFVIINFALWAIVHVLPFEFGSQIYQWGAGHNLSIYQYGEYWRLFTPIFLHADFTHALFNSFSLVLFGPALEQMLGRYKFVIAYLVAGIIGNVGTYLVNPLSYIPHIGASGAVYGLFGIYIFMVLFRKHLIDSGSTQIIVTIFFIGLVMTFIRPGINIYAHIFGFVGGFAVSPIVLAHAVPFSIYRNRRRRAANDGTVQFDPNRWTKKKRIPSFLKKNILWIIIGILVLFGLLGRLF